MMTNRPSSLSFMRTLPLAWGLAAATWLVACSAEDAEQSSDAGPGQTGGFMGNLGTGGGQTGVDALGDANQPGSGGRGGMPGAGGNVALSGEPAELKGITELHNVERRKVGVPDLTWDPALAAIAQTWASKCVDKDAPIGLVDHNPNRGAGYQGSVGENLFGSSGTATAQQAVGAWVAELSAYNYAKNTCSSVCGHYTQVVWKTTTKVGCAVFKCAGLKYGGTLVCDYSPAGNVNGQRPY